LFTSSFFNTKNRKNQPTENTIGQKIFNFNLKHTVIKLRNSCFVLKHIQLNLYIHHYILWASLIYLLDSSLPFGSLTGMKTLVWSLLHDLYFSTAVSLIIIITTPISVVFRLENVNFVLNRVSHHYILIPIVITLQSHNS